MRQHFPSFAPHRRRFLALAAGTCGSLLAGGYLQARPRFSTYTRKSKALGSAVTMTALHEDRAVAESAVTAAFLELERIEDIMSLYRHDSQLCRLNREGFLDKADSRLLEVLRHAADVAQKSGGAFDITVQPLWQVHAAAQRENRAPHDAELEKARACVDWRRVRVSDARVSLDGAGTSVTLNGIAQGYAADAAMRVMRAHGVAHALIDTGELGALGQNAGGEPWKAGIQHPRREDAYAVVAKLQNRCLATSGDYETSFSTDFSRHHVFDPRTGMSPGELASVSVLAPTAMAADALSTALFVLGAERGSAWLQSFPETDALLILKSGRRLATPEFPFAA